VPLHFYGELTKTTEGCRILEEKGHFDEFALFILSCKDEEEDTEVILKLKSCLWAVGNIGANDGGVPFLVKFGIVKDIVSIAEQSSVISLKGYRTLLSYEC
jgi:rapamycin-insensitive companion of mTOR